MALILKSCFIFFIVIGSNPAIAKGNIYRLQKMQNGSYGQIEVLKTPPAWACDDCLIFQDPFPLEVDEDHLAKHTNTADPIEYKETLLEIKSSIISARYAEPRVKIDSHSSAHQRKPSFGFDLLEKSLSENPDDF